MTNLQYTDSHEWLEIEGDIARVGISFYAQKQLGEIVYIELPIIGRSVHVNQEIAVLESTKAATDVYAPVSGVIVEVNAKLSLTPELINQSPEKDGWICKIRFSNTG